MTEPIWVKVCGLTRPADVDVAIEAGADAIGLVLVADSPRRLSAQRASELAAMAQGRVDVVALVDGQVADAMATAGRLGVAWVQPYGDDAVEIALAAMQAGYRVLFPVAVDADSGVGLEALPAGAKPLLDTAVAGRLGGTGKTFDWGRATAVAGAVIAGGLTPENVAAAIGVAAPWGVDASSGLETAVGIKDHSKVASFVSAAKSS